MQKRVFTSLIIVRCQEKLIFFSQKSHSLQKNMHSLFSRYLCTPNVLRSFSNSSQFHSNVVVYHVKFVSNYKNTTNKNKKQQKYLKKVCEFYNDGQLTYVCFQSSRFATGLIRGFSANSSKISLASKILNTIYFSLPLPVQFWVRKLLFEIKDDKQNLFISRKRTKNKAPL